MVLGAVTSRGVISVFQRIILSLRVTDVSDPSHMTRHSIGHRSIFRPTSCINNARGYQRSLLSVVDDPAVSHTATAMSWV